MGTRGAFGFRIDGKDKVMYNHFDSYPACLGKKVADFIAGTTDNELRGIAENLVMVDEDSKPTVEQKKAIRDFEKKHGVVVSNTSVASRSLDDWYCLLREAQGEPELYKKGLEYAVDSDEFLKCSLFCEYAYIINVDAGALEVYFGFNKNPNAKGRYARFKSSDVELYCGVKLVKEYPFDAVRKDPGAVIDELEKLND